MITIFASLSIALLVVVLTLRDRTEMSRSEYRRWVHDWWDRAQYQITCDVRWEDLLRAVQLQQDIEALLVLHLERSVEEEDLSGWYRDLVLFMGTYEALTALPRTRSNLDDLGDWVRREYERLIAEMHPAMLEEPVS